MTKINQELFPYSDGSGYEISIDMDDESIKIQQFGDQYVEVSLRQWATMSQTINSMLNATKAIFKG